jgi:hypothetical protein
MTSAGRCYRRNAMTRAAFILRVGAGVVAALGCVGCSYTVFASDGKVFTGSLTNHPGRDALRWSAAHDLPCTSDRLDVRDMATGEELTWEPSPGNRVAATGCGWRVVYEYHDVGTS